MPFRHPENLCNFLTDEAIADNANDLTLPPVKEMLNIPALIFPHVLFSESAGLVPRLVNLCNSEANKRPNSLPNLVKILSDIHCLLSRDASKGPRDDLEGPAGMYSDIFAS